MKLSKSYRSIIYIFFLLTIVGCDLTTRDQSSAEFITKKYPNFPWKAFDSALGQSNLDGNIKDAEIILLKGGLSPDALFLLKLRGKEYVLRFLGDYRPVDQKKIIAESFKWAGSYSFGPKVYLIDKENYSFILTEFLEGRTLTLDDTKDRMIIQSLGDLLSQVHSAPLPLENYQEFSQFTYGQEWYRSVIDDAHKKPIGPSVLKLAYKRWLKINNQIKKPLKKSMLHNDPNLKNVLWSNGKITLLDWELAGIGDPRKEIAHVCAWYGLSEELINIFLESYYHRRPTRQELETLKMLKIQILLEFAWVGLSTLKTELNQETWDEYYKNANPANIQDLSIIQMKSETRPPEDETRNIFLGLIKQFMIETSSK